MIRSKGEDVYVVQYASIYLPSKEDPEGFAGHQATEDEDLDAEVAEGEREHYIIVEWILLLELLRPTG